MFLHSSREGDHPNQIQHPENIKHLLVQLKCRYICPCICPANICPTYMQANSNCPYLSADMQAQVYMPIIWSQVYMPISVAQLYLQGFHAYQCITNGTNAEQNQEIFKVSTSFLARILKPTHHMVNLSNESDQA
jgi:hypothetical protein